MSKVLNWLRKLAGVRSPILESCGYYTCGNCTHHDDCICVVCEEGNTVVCNLQHKHVDKNHTCKRAKPIAIKQLKARKNGCGLRAKIGVIDEWSGCYE